MKRENSPCIIAEAGVNHNGSVRIAKELVDVACAAGVDAVKFQTFRAEDLATRQAPFAAYQKRNRGKRGSQHSMLKGLELGEKEHREIYLYCKKKGIEFLSTPFDEASLEFLVALGIRKIKISSGDLTNGPLLLKAARTKLPVILSTGMSGLKEVRDALTVLAFGYLSSAPAASFSQMKRMAGSRKAGTVLRRKVILLQCTTEYPAQFCDINLRAMDTLREAFGCVVGLSDHSDGISVSIAAAARGAAVIEKHFTLDKDLPGPDHRASLEPDELAALVKGVRSVNQALGNGKKEPSRAESRNIPVAQKTLVAAMPIAKGDSFRPDNVICKRAGRGLSPMSYWDILGKVAARNYIKDEVIRYE